MALGMLVVCVCASWCLRVEGSRLVAGEGMVWWLYEVFLVRW